MKLSGGRIPLTWHMLTHRKGRLILSILGITFAVVLMFMQLGFLTGLFDSQTLMLRRLDADIVITSLARHNLHVEEAFAKSRLLPAHDVPGVASVTTVAMENGMWRNPQTGLLYVIRVIGVDPDHPPFAAPDLTEPIRALQRPDSVVFDRASRDFFGQVEEGSEVELVGRPLRVVGEIDLGADFKNDGTAVVSLDTFSRVFSYLPADNVALGVVRLAPGAKVASAVEDLRAVLEPGMVIESLADYERRERQFWAKTTPTGFIFTLGLIVGFVIGVMICYQILYNEINDHLPQFATLKAVGFPESYLVGIVIREAVLLAILGLVPAIIASQLFYWTMIELSGLRMELTIPRVLLISVLTLAMCMVSGLLAVNRVLKADPAEVF